MEIAAVLSAILSLAVLVIAIVALVKFFEMAKDVHEINWFLLHKGDNDNVEMPDLSQYSPKERAAIESYQRSKRN